MFDCHVHALDDYDWKRFPGEDLVVFVVSTTGDGDAPDNMVEFWKFIRKRNLPATALSNVLFTVFGMGDSSYAKYNAVARKLHVRMKQLGAVEFCPLGLGDDQSANGVESDADAWAKVMWSMLLARYPLPKGFVVDDTPRFDAEKDISYAMTYGEGARSEGNAVCEFYDPPLRSYDIAFGPIPCVLKTNKRLTAESWTQDVRHVELGLLRPVPYEAGDIAVVYPQNVFDVDAFLQGYRAEKDGQGESYSGDDVVNLTSKGTGRQGLPAGCTVRDLFLKHLDVLGVPKRYALEQLSHFASDPEQQEKLLEISSSSGVDLYHSYIWREKRSFLEVLEDFASCRPPLEVLASIVPFIRPREYSISSSGSKHAHRELHVTVAVVEYTTFYKRVRRGLCSTWLAGLEHGAPVTVWVKKGILKTPPLHAPMILVGPGTGVAPMRSLVQERVHAIAAGEQGHGGVVGQTYLFFGNRKAGSDFLYKDEFNAYARDKKLNLITAFSRDQAHKVYVQHRLVEAKEAVWDQLSRKDAVLYISGSSKGMPNDVYKGLLSIATESGQLSEKDAIRFFSTMKLQKRYLVECWS
jgi:sulfite reductase alpha subunit-like flavoprotein|eukprot:g6819.t1